MPIRCVERPNRKHTRGFRTSDLERIARYIHEDSGLSPWKILGSAVAGLGLGAVICKIVAPLRRILSVWGELGRLTKAQLVVLALIAILERIINSPLRFLPFVRTVIAIGIATLLAFNILFNKLIGAISDALEVGEITNRLEEMCGFIGEKLGDAGDLLEGFDIPDIGPGDLTNIFED